MQEQSGEDKALDNEPTEEKVVEVEDVNYKDKYFYLAAELTNQQKRFEREKANIIKFGSESILKDVVNSVDLFELTVNALKSDEDAKIKNIVVGLDMIRKQLLEGLTKHGLERVETKGKVFDPNFHEAIAQESHPDLPPQTIVIEHQAGYLVNGRLLRASKVVVNGHS
jgi:molecular chaperone GrpE